MQRPSSPPKRYSRDGVDGEIVLSYVQHSWRLDDVDAQSAVAAARVLARRASGGTAASPD
jgi:hypothetical protein